MPRCPGLRRLGLGPDLRPSRALLKLQRLFDRHAFWAAAAVSPSCGGCWPAAMPW